MNPLDFKMTARTKFHKNNNPLRLTVNGIEDPVTKVEMMETN
jgi:hypothetical protein